MDESLSKNRVLPQRPYFSPGGRPPEEEQAAPEEKIQDRIRRAIERNRAKQEASANRMKVGGGFKSFAEREKNIQADEPPPFPGRGSGEAQSANSKLQELKERLRAKHQEKNGPSGIRGPSSHTHGANSTSNTSYLPRAIKQESNAGKILRQKLGEVNPKVKEWAIKGGWFFCFVLLLRLIFAENGVLDYFKMEKILTGKSEELSAHKTENFALMEEIEKIQNNASYQKKLVRDNLGFVAQDEYLILFAKESPTAASASPQP